MTFRATGGSATPMPHRRVRLVMVALLLAAGMTTAGTASGMPLSPAVNGGSGCDVSSTDPGFSIGVGSSADPYIVTNSAQLASLDVTKHYRQACDLNLASYSNWAGVGGTNTAFSGVYDGDGFTISNVSISASTDNWGLFRQANGATIKNLTLTDVTISADSNVGSLIGNAGNVTVSTVTVSANVTGSGNSVGGLIGYTYADGGSVDVTGSYATGTVTGSTYAGGLIGYARAWGSGSTVGVTSSYATGAVTGSGNIVGGLIGWAYADGGSTVGVTSSYATGTVTGASSVGGLIGWADVGGGSTVGVTGSYATGDVTGSASVGGLIGYAYAFRSGSTLGVTGSYATGTVTGSAGVGGLIGYAYADGGSVDVTSSYATGAVTGIFGVGGLIGDAYANGGSVNVTDSYGTGAVNGRQFVGGLIGKAYAFRSGSTLGVTGSYATGAVTGSDLGRVGGLIGWAEADGGSVNVTDSYATGAVNGTIRVGGLIGQAYAHASGSVGVTGSYATGAVNGSGNGVGGLIGDAYANGGSVNVTASYATGAVTGNNFVGGFIGSAGANGGSTVGVTDSYATGTVTGSTRVGGLIGDESVVGTVTVSASFWDVSTSGVATSAGGTPKTTEQMKLFDTFDGAGWSITQFDSDQNAVWGICDGLSYAYLRWESQRPSACSPSSSDQTTLPAPSTTTPPTTVAPVDPAAPVLVNGVLPELSPGEVAVYENGAVITVEPGVENNTDLVLRDPGFELRLTGHCTNGCNIETISDGRHVVTLEQHNVVNVNGQDFQPGSTVYVWLFSAPILLGQLTVNADGIVTGEVGLGDITPGNHTLQMNAINSQGDTLSINIGVIVIPEQAPTPAAGVLPATGSTPTPAAGVLPATGSNTTPIWLTALTLLGLGLVTTSRRRRASHN